MAEYDLGTARGKIVLDPSGAVAGAAAASKATDDLGTSAKRNSANLTTVGTAMTGVGVAAVAGFALAVNAAADFEAGLSNIKAVSGATESEMESLRQKALRLGADTAFSAGEAASAMEELVKAGLSVDDVLNGAADATVNLAAAGEIALPEAAEIAAAAMNNFNLSAAEMPKIADLIAGSANASAISVSDFGLAMKQSGASASLVGLSFDDMALAITAMGNAGIKGSDAGTSLKTMLMNLQPSSEKQANLFKELGLLTGNAEGAIASLTEKGFKPLSGSMDHVREAASNYLAETKGIPNDTKEMGKAVDDFLMKNGGMQNAFFDSAGKIKSMAEISDVLKGALAGMTEQQQAATLETLFGSDAIRAAAIIAKEGSEGFAELTTAMGKVTAAEVAATKMDNFKGSIEQLKGSFETFMIVAGTPFLGVLRAVVDGVTGIVNAFSNAPPQMVTIVTAVVAIGGALIGMAGALTLAYKAFQSFKTALTALKIGAMLTNPIGIAVLALAAIAAALVIAYQRSETFRNIVQGAFEVVRDVIDKVKLGISALVAAFKEGDVTSDGFVGVMERIGNVARDVVQFIQGFVDSIGGWGNVLKGVGGAVVVLVAPLAALVAGLVYAYQHFETFRDIVSTVIGVLKTVASTVGTALVAGFQQAVTWLSTNVFPIFTALGALVAAMVERISAILPSILPIFTVFFGIVETGFKIIQIAIEFFINTIVAAWEMFGDNLVAIVKIAWDLIWGTIESALKVIQGVIKTLTAVISGDWGEAWNGIKQILAGVWDFMSNIVNVAIRTIQAIISTAVDTIHFLWNTAWQGIQSILDAAWEAIKGIVNAGIDFIWAVIKAALEGLLTFWDSVWDGIWEVITDVWGAITRTVEEAISGVSDYIGDTISEIAETWDTIWTGVKTFFTTLWGDIKTTVSNAITDVVSFVSGIPGRVASTLGDLGSTLLQKGKDLIQGMRNGIEEIANGIVTYVTDFPDRLVRGIGNISDLLLDTGKKIIGGLKRGIEEAVEDLLGFVGGIAGRIARAKGPLTYDAKVLVPNGETLVAGLLSGIKRGMAEVVAYASDIAPTLQTTIAPADAGSLGGSGGGNTYNFHFDIDGMGANGAEEIRQTLMGDDVVSVLVAAARGGRRG